MVLWTNPLPLLSHPAPYASSSLALSGCSVPSLAPQGPLSLWLLPLPSPSAQAPRAKGLQALVEGVWLGPGALLSLLGCVRGTQSIACHTCSFLLVLAAILNTSLFPGGVKNQNRRASIMQWGFGCRAPKDLLGVPESEGYNWVTQRGRDPQPLPRPSSQVPS